MVGIAFWFLVSATNEIFVPPSDFFQAKFVDEKNEDPVYKKAVMHFYLRDYGLAVKHLVKYIKLNPEDEKAKLFLEEIYDRYRTFKKELIRGIKKFEEFRYKEASEMFFRAKMLGVSSLLLEYIKKCRRKIYEVRNSVITNVDFTVSEGFVKVSFCIPDNWKWFGRVEVWTATVDYSPEFQVIDFLSRSGFTGEIKEVVEKIDGVKKEKFYVKDAEVIVKSPAVVVAFPVSIDGIEGKPIFRFVFSPVHLSPDSLRKPVPDVPDVYPYLKIEDSLLTLSNLIRRVRSIANRGVETNVTTNIVRVPIAGVSGEEGCNGSGIFAVLLVLGVLVFAGIYLKKRFLKMIIPIALIFQIQQPTPYEFLKSVMDLNFNSEFVPESVKVVFTRTMNEFKTMAISFLNYGEYGKALYCAYVPYFFSLSRRDESYFNFIVRRVRLKGKLDEAVEKAVSESSNANAVLSSLVWTSLAVNLGEETPDLVLRLAELRRKYEEEVRLMAEETFFHRVAEDLTDESPEEKIKKEMAGFYSAFSYLPAVGEEFAKVINYNLEIEKFNDIVNEAFALAREGKFKESLKLFKEAKKMLSPYRNKTLEDNIEFLKLKLKILRVINNLKKILKERENEVEIS